MYYDFVDCGLLTMDSINFNQSNFESNLKLIKLCFFNTYMINL